MVIYLYKIQLAPTAGLEPATSKLTASCSTIELRRNTRAIIPLPLSFRQYNAGWVIEVVRVLLWRLRERRRGRGFLGYQSERRVRRGSSGSGLFYRYRNGR